MSPSPRSRRRTTFLVAALLALLTVAAFARVRTLGFVDFDDDEYVTENRHVNGGLSLANAVWALTSYDTANWHPVTWLSLQLDSSLNGPGARGFHLTNLFFHLLATLLLFAALHRMTGWTWRAFFIAAFFSLHPLRVESVAWVSERKDVLGAFFWTATMTAYAFYVEEPTRRKHALVIVLFVLGLMSKPMLVTLPFALLLLDYWPLGRKLAWKEKRPLFAIAILTGAFAIFAQRAGGALVTPEKIGILARAGNFAVTVIAYLGKMAWPRDLIPFYPYPLSGIALARVAASAGVLLLLSALAWRERRRNPHFIVGWLWYLGTLVPVAGLVQVGWQSMADRYTYLPSIGIFLAVVCEGARHLEKNQWVKAALLSSAFSALLILAALTRAQIPHWRDSQALWSHTLSIDPDNQVAMVNLCTRLFEKKERDEAVRCYQSALERVQGKPALPRTLLNLHKNLGILKLTGGETAEAEHHFKAAIEADPANAYSYDCLGKAHLLLNQPEVASRDFLEALRRGLIPPDESYLALAEALAKDGRANLAFPLLDELSESHARHEDFRSASETILFALKLDRGLGGDRAARYEAAARRYSELAFRAR